MHPTTSTEEPPKLSRGVSTAETAVPLMEVKDFNFFYGKKQALHSINMSIPDESGHGVHRPVGLREDPPFCAISTG